MQLLIYSLGQNIEEKLSKTLDNNKQDRFFYGVFYSWFLAIL